VRIPLALFNVNHIPNSGLVALFDVSGSIWDDEQQTFRFLGPDELENAAGTDSVKTKRMRLTFSSYNLDTECGVLSSQVEDSGKQFDKPVSVAADWDVFVTDIEPIRKAIQNELAERQLFAAFQCTTQSVRVVDAQTPVHSQLSGVFSYEVISACGIFFLRQSHRS
jgi:hypothetical protein